MIYFRVYITGPPKSLKSVFFHHDLETQKNVPARGRAPNPDSSITGSVI